MGEKIAAIVLAAGEGKRMGSGIPKQYMLIKSRPLVYYALKAFEESAVDEVILVTGEDEIDYCKEYIVDRYHFNKVTKIVPGGWERYASVYFGLEAIEDADYVLIHDGARPMISAELVQKCIYYVKKYRACVVGMPSKDTIKVVDEENYAIRTPERKTLWQVQTPQCFEFDLVKKAYVKRVRSEKDRRVVLISLTEKGVKAYHHHANFHDEMIKATLNGLNEEQTKVLVKALTNLSAFFRTYGK